MGTTLITFLGVLVLHDCMMVVFQNNLSKKPLVIGLPMVSERINVPHRHSKGKQARFCWVLFQKKAVIDVEKKDENGAEENYIAREVKAVSPEKCDQEGSNQSIVVSANSTRIVISYK